MVIGAEDGVGWGAADEATKSAKGSLKSAFDVDGGFCGVAAYDEENTGEKLRKLDRKGSWTSNVKMPKENV